MYKFSYFTEKDPEKVLAFMQENPFAVITGISDEHPVATHIPLSIKVQEDTLIMTGHLMKNTDHHKAFIKNKNVLVIFNGPHCYVSASWYNDPRVASTWNYITVHAKGEINFTDETGTRKMVEEITNKYEGLESKSSFNNLSKEYVDKLVKAIVGFTIQVKSFDNVFKLSQNHEEETRLNIIRNLNKNGGDGEKRIAKEMEQRIKMPKL
jgi:transcriptional regulator